MFDNVKFEGTINLGAICVAIIQLISSIGVYFRVKAIIAEKGIKIDLFTRKKSNEVPPAKPGENVDNSQKVLDKSDSQESD